MWEVLVRTPLGRLSTRKFVMLLATLLVVTFGYIFVASPSAYAIEGSWKDGELIYNDHTYEGPRTPSGSDGLGLSDDTQYYTYTPSGQSGVPRNVWVIYFAPGVSPPEATEAKLARYSFDGERYSDKTRQQDITLTVENSDATPPSEPPQTDSSCELEGLGWLVCPTSNWIAQGMDFLYGILAQFLSTKPILGGDNGLYYMWDLVRNIANICFAIGFLILIYGQITGGTVSNYTIKKVLPRIIIAAILVNISYWVCALAVDLSNVSGSAVQSMFMSTQESLGPANSLASDISWEKVTAVVLSGGALGTIAVASASAGGVGALAFAVIAALFPALFAIFIAVTILAARQALITVLIIIAPLAFAAYLLPNTEDWFKKWRKLFIALMVMFPAFAVIFGGAQLTGLIIIQNADSIPVVILGLLVQTIPLFITPFLIKLSSGLLGTIAGLANDKSKGVFDKGQNWANANREMHKARAMRNAANRAQDMRQNGASRRRRAFNAIRPTTGMSRLASGQMHRENMTKAYQAQAEAGYMASNRGRRAYNENQFGSDAKAAAEHANDEAWQRRVAGDQLSERRTGIGRNREDQRYQNHQAMLHESHRAHVSAGIIKDAIEQEGERHVREHIANAAAGTYDARLRDMQIRATVDQGIAAQAKSVVETQGQWQLQETVLASAALLNQAQRVHEFQGRAEQAKQLIEDNSKAAWEQLTLDDRTIYSRQLERQANAKQLKALQNEWESILAEASAGRTDDYQRRHGPITQQVSEQVDLIREADQTINVEERRKANAEYVAKTELTSRLKDDEALLDRAAGIDENGRTKVISNLSKESGALHMQNMEAVESYMSNEGYTLDEQKDIMQGKAIRGSTTPPSELERHAAMRRILLTNGNNWAAQEVFDYVVSQGMDYDTTLKAFVDDSGTVLSDDEVERRRNLQQIYKDAESKSGLKVDYISGTDKGMLEGGMLKRRDPSLTASEQHLMRDIIDAKIKGSRIMESDIDIISRQVQVFLDPANVAKIDAASPEARRKYVDMINETLSDPMQGGRMAEREWSMTKVLANMLDDTDTRPMDVKLREYVDRKGQVKQVEKPITRNTYRYTR